MNDTDILAREYAALGARIAALNAAGTCTHDALRGPGGNATHTCQDCGRVFATFADAVAAHHQAIYG